MHAAKFPGKARSMFKHLVFLAALAPLPAWAQGSTAAKVGAIYAMSGDMASWGKNCWQGAELALLDLKERSAAPQLQLILEDSPNAKPTNAISAFRKLTDTDHVQYILGPMSPEEYAAVAPLADRAGIPLLPFVSSKIKVPAALFMWMDPETEAQRIAEYVAARHKRVLVLSSNQEWEALVGQTFKAYVTEKGLSVPLIEEPPFDSSEVRSQIAKVRQEKFDAIFITSYLLFPKYMKALSAAGIQVPLYSIELDASAIAATGGAAEGLVFIRPAAPNERFIQAFHSKWGSDPDVPASQCYDSVMILSRALAAGATNKESFSAYVKDFPKFEGASGTISVENGKTIMSTELFQVSNGAIVRLETGPSNK
ncbi:MAG: ABC transporter substrate-binding protein [Deltaproteobacteria bacterium]|nr:ABC transporter substrate-binding protein [Deltaproteobacteria bacterium]